MDEHASFEARAVLAPRRARLARLAPLLLAVALVAIGWAGLAGPRTDPATADRTDPSAIADAPSNAARATAVTAAPSPQRPTQALGLNVQRLDEIQTQGLARDHVIAISGWYVATTITDCPPLAVSFRAEASPRIGADVDGWAYCKRSGVLYASPPAAQDSRSGSAGLGAVGATVVAGVVMPPALETIGAGPTQVVVLGRFVEPTDGCRTTVDCSHSLIVDYVAWTADS
ncbi:MAG TPA: hypothetical protein VGM49_08290 [Candidatus Limnocylindrales bacterium]|jgi:hypothetical protein